jgi:hypothetical protein
MAHRDSRLPKTEEARVMSHDPLIPDATEEDAPLFTAQEVLALDAAAKKEEAIFTDLPVGRDAAANEENSAKEDQSANVADANVNPDSDSDLRTADARKAEADRKDERDAEAEAEAKAAQEQEKLEAKVAAKAEKDAKAEAKAKAKEEKDANEGS